MANRIYKNTYFQGTLTDREVEQLLHIRELEEVPVLKNSIYYLSEQEIVELQELGMESYEKEVTFPPRSAYKQGTLNPVQTVGVAFMMTAKRCLLGDSVGLGKTVQTAALCNLVSALYKQQGKDFRFCYLSEKNTVLELQRKLIQFTGEYIDIIKNAESKTVQTFVDNNSKLGQKKSRYNVIGTHALINSADFMLYNARYPFDMIIIDESAFLKNKTNEVYKNVKALLKKTPYRILLNATPVETGIEDMYAQLSLLDELYMPDLTTFRQDYCQKDINHKVIGVKNTAIFTEAVKLRYIARRRKEQETVKYEDNKSYRYVVEYSADQRRIKKRTSMFQMVYDYPAGVDLMLEPTIENTPKVACVLNILDKLGTEKVMVYCFYKEAQAFLEQVLKEKGYKVGCTVNKNLGERKQILADFVSGDTQVLITNMKKGLDINTCNHCILYTVDTNPANLLQVEGRMTRDMNICGKNIYLLVMSGDEEKKVNTLLKKRVNIANSLVSADFSMILENIVEKSNEVYFNVEDYLQS